MNLSCVSARAYKVMRESEISLPTRRTLNDYSHWISARPGFSSEVIHTEAKVNELEDWQRFIVLHRLTSRGQRLRTSRGEILNAA